LRRLSARDQFDTAQKSGRVTRSVVWRIRHFASS
jgi:hypothetical protein